MSPERSQRPFRSIVGKAIPEVILEEIPLQALQESGGWSHFPVAFFELAPEGSGGEGSRPTFSIFCRWSQLAGSSCIVCYVKLSLFSIWKISAPEGSGGASRPTFGKVCAELLGSSLL